MLTPQEKMYARELLGALDDEDLLTLAKTSTNHSLRPTTKEEAIEIIISYEENTRSLLNRKKITKVLLFNYLHWKKVEFPATSDKCHLVETVIQFWETGVVQSTNSYCTTPMIQHTPEPTQIFGSSSKQSIVQSLNSNTCRNEGVVECTFLPCQVAKVDDSTNWINIMALKFSEWFYSCLNADPDNAENFLKEQDFWKDSIANINISSGNENVNFDAKNNSEVIDMIKVVKRDYNLIFCPNINSLGVKGKLDPHGIVLVGACGTLHYGGDQCVGVFEQLFSLIKDPLSSDNWKVKRTSLKLRKECNVVGPPALNWHSLETS